MNIARSMSLLIAAGALVSACGGSSGANSSGASGSAGSGNSGGNAAGGAAGASASGSGGSTAGTGGSAAGGAAGASGSGGSGGSAAGTGGGAAGASGSGGSTAGAGGSAGGAAGTAGTAGTAAVQCWPAPASFPTFARSCVTKNDCASVTHQTNCCGTRVITGVAASEMTRFTADEKTCDAQYPACGCANGPTMTDTGQVVTLIADVQVECQGGVCTTFLP